MVDKKALIISSDENPLPEISGTLQGLGYEIVRANSPQQALDLYKTVCPCLIIADVGTDGEKVLFPEFLLQSEIPQDKPLPSYKETSNVLKEYELLRVLMDNVPDSIYFKDLEGRFVMVNKAKASNSSTTPEAMTGRTDFDFLNPDHAAAVKALEDEIIQTGKQMVGNIETLVRKTGDKVHILANKVPWYDSGGNIIGTIGISRDITEFKEAKESLEQAKNDLEKRIDERTAQLKTLNEKLLDEINERKLTELGLRASEEKYRSLIDNINIGIALINPALEILSVNKQMKLWFPWLQTDNLPVDYRQISPNHKDDLCSYCPTCLTLEDGQLNEIITKSEDGNIHYRIVSTPVKDKKGKILAAIEMREDITESKRMEDEIRKNYQTQAAINLVLKIALEPISLIEQLDKTLDLVLSIPWLSLQSKGSIFTYDDVTSSLNMVSVRGLSDFLQQTCKNVPAGMCLCGRCALTREIIFVGHLDDRHDVGYEGMKDHGHYCVPIQKGSQLLGVINLYVDAGHKRNHMEEAFLRAVADSIAGMMEKNRNEIEKQKLQQQLMHSEKLSALGRLSASVAHEIRNPLTAIGGFARRLHKMVLEGTKEREYADVISAESSRLEIILKNILSYSRGESHSISLQNINEIMAETIRNYSETMAEKSIKVYFTAGNLPLIKLDRTQIRQVFDNLVTNAIDAMPCEGGSIKIKTESTVKDNVKCALIIIEDSGTGIPPEKVNMIFEPFFSTKEMGRGTGLGLPITRRIITEHGGMIHVESSPGTGSVFSVYLPFKE
ncbi:MAG: PAS domain-containing protein [Nitrospirae bacterium YQR-1]